MFVHCATGRRSAMATAYLRRQGYDAINLDGGYRAWKMTADAIAAPVES